MSYTSGSTGVPRCAVWMSAQHRSPGARPRLRRASWPRAIASPSGQLDLRRRRLEESRARCSTAAAWSSIPKDIALARARASRSCSASGMTALFLTTALFNGIIIWAFPSAFETLKCRAARRRGREPTVSAASAAGGAGAPAPRLWSRRDHDLATWRRVESVRPARARCPSARRWPTPRSTCSTRAASSVRSASMKAVHGGS